MKQIFLYTAVEGLELWKKVWEDEISKFKIGKTMYDLKDLSNEGKHDFERSPYEGKSWAKTISVGIFQLVKRSNGKSLKKGPVLVRVKGSSSDVNKIYARAQKICYELNAGVFDVSIKRIILK